MQAVLKNGNLIWINGTQYGYKTGPYIFIPIPNQDVSSLFQRVDTPTGGKWQFTGTSDDITWEFPVGDLPHSEHIGKLMSVNPSNAKPAVVRRKYLGVFYDVPCFVSQAIVNMWTAVPKEVDIGDYVLVSFIDENPDDEEKNIAIVTDKVYNSW